MELASALVGSGITAIVFGVAFLIFWVKNHHAIIKTLTKQVKNHEDNIIQIYDRIGGEINGVNHRITDSVTQIHQRIDQEMIDIKDRIK